MENIISMENVIYQKHFTKGVLEFDKLEFFINDTNELNSSKTIKELSLTIISKDIQLDTYFDSTELDSLIDYLQNCREYIKVYNK